MDDQFSRLRTIPARDGHRPTLFIGLSVVVTRDKNWQLTNFLFCF